MNCFSTDYKSALAVHRLHPDYYRYGGGMIMTPDFVHRSLGEGAWLMTINDGEI